MIKLLKNFDFTVRLLFLIALVLLSFSFLFYGAKTALAGEVKNIVVIEDSVIRAGDLFENLSESKASRVIGNAPQPGQDLILEANLLRRVAIALDISWRPVSLDNSITIRRSATLITAKTLESVIKDGLIREGLDGEFNLKITGGISDIILPHDQPGTVDIHSLRFDSARDIFEITLVAPSIDNPMSQSTLTGHIERLITIPVLNTSLTSGMIIGERDIDYINIKSAELQKDYLLNSDDIIGLTPRRVINAGKPIRTIDIQSPVLVKRGDNVSIVLTTSELELSAQGRSLQNGAKGDLVKVVNVNSNMSIEAIVTGDKVVSVRP
jgi:flagella basal body P-ring formation protein FlgA